MKSEIKVNPIPRTLAPAFPEYRLRDLDVRKDAAIIIERTLEQGTRRELQWLFQMYSREQIQDFVRDAGARRLTKRAFNFWRLVLGIVTFRPIPFQELRETLWGR